MKDFKVITNPNPRPEEEEEKELELTLIEPDVMADLYFTSAFFHYLKTGHDGYYFAEKELNEMELAQKKVFPLLERNFAEFVRLTKKVRKKESISLAQLIYVYDAEDSDYTPFFDVLIQSSFYDFFKQSVLIRNPELIYIEEGDEILEALDAELMESGYFEEVFQGILTFLDDKENLFNVLFSDDEEEE